GPGRTAVTRSLSGSRASLPRHPREREPPLEAGDADGAGHAGATEPAVPARVLGEVLLVVVLRVIERRQRPDLGRDLAEAGVEQPALEGLARPLGRLPLGLAREVDARAVLGPDVIALAHTLRW